MFVLPTALASLRGYRQFVPFKLVASATRPGKTDKFPIDYRTGAVSNAHDAGAWMDAESCATYADMLGPNHGVGFVFTPADPFFFIDIDDCAEPGGWSHTAQAMLQSFAGAAVEVSVSGTGLHIIGCGNAGPPPPARKVKYGSFFDLYTENRFVALTGTAAGGDAWTDHTPALQWLVATYLTPDAATTAEWTTAPDPRWRGPTDDAELVRRALRSQSSAQAFGTRASFQQLWEKDVDALARCYPDDHKTRPYDESRADSALAQALAFWAGKDCERILRIMWQSGLVRQKWHDRPDYLRTTIELVVARQHDVLQDKPPQEHTAVVAAAGTSAMAVPVTGETWLSAEEQMKIFAGCVYVCNLHRVLVPGGHLLKPDQFKVMYGGYSFPMDPQNERVVRNAWEAFTESQSFRAPRADGLCFRPERTPGELITEAGTTLANIWWPIQTPATDGDISPFLVHMEKLLPDADDRAKLLAYMAAVVQYPGRKFQWAPLVQGVEGNGKTLIITALSQCVGDRYTHLPNTEDLVAGGAKFTGWLQNKLFIGLEEIYTGERRNMMDALKPLITNSRIEIQAKGQDQFTGDNRANFVACSNHKDAVPKTANERRWAIFFTAQQKVEDLAAHGMGGNYMPALYNWFWGRDEFDGHTPGAAIINHFLRSYAIPDALNPTKDMHRAPDTSSTNEAIGLSVGGIEQAILEAIGEERPGFAGGWVSSMAVDRLLVQLKAERRVPPNRRRIILEGLGYFYHPALEDGRVPNAVTPDNGRTRLFAKRGHPINVLSTVQTVCKIYQECQSKTLTAGAKFG